MSYGVATLLSACAVGPQRVDSAPSPGTPATSSVHPAATVAATPDGSRTGAPATTPVTAPSGGPSGSAGSRPATAPAIVREPGPDVTAGTSGRPEVALTFHGQGDPGIARGVLAACATAGARITVFAVGQWVEQYPQLAREIVGGGHDLGNHTWSHLELPTLSLAAATTEIKRCADALAKAVGSAGWYFRPSSTVTSTPTIRQAAQAAGYARCIGYGVDPEDFREPGAAVVRARTKAGLRSGAIVSLHLGHQGTLDALPGILADVRAAGLAAVSLTTLLSS